MYNCKTRFFPARCGQGRKTREDLEQLFEAFTFLKETVVMNDDRDLLIEALESAVSIFRSKKVGSSLLGQPKPDNEVLDPLSAMIEKCEAFKAVSGQVLFSAHSGVVLQASTLAVSLLYRAEINIPDAAEWLLRLLQTREAKGEFKAAIWGISVDKEISLSASSRLMPFELLPASNIEFFNIKNWILRRAQPKPIWNGSEWVSSRLFNAPRATFIREISNFPYIRTDNKSFKVIERLEREARELWTLLEAISIGHPLAFGYWFDYADRDLDFSSFDNTIVWSLPEITPCIAQCTPVDMQSLHNDLHQYTALPKNLRSNLLRSMDRFTLSQCRHQVVDRALDLTLAFEIAVSGKGESAPPSWKVSVRSAQLIGGDLKKRQDNRRKIAELYNLRNKATHGSSLKDADQTTVLEASNLYPFLLRSFLRLGKEPDWSSLELEPIFG
jgi:hypothetical protein